MVSITVPPSSTNNPNLDRSSVLVDSPADVHLPAAHVALCAHLAVLVVLGDTVVDDVDDVVAAHEEASVSLGLDGKRAAALGLDGDVAAEAVHERATAWLLAQVVGDSRAVLRQRLALGRRKNRLPALVDELVAVVPYRSLRRRREGEESHAQ